MQKNFRKNSKKPINSKKEKSLETKIYKHPSTYMPIYRSYLIKLLVFSVLGILWSFGGIILSLWYTEELNQSHHFYGKVLFFYSWYSSIHSFYIGLSVGLSYFLAAKSWLKIACIAAMIPGAGIFFGIFQFSSAFRIFQDLKGNQWDDLFRWRITTKEAMN